MADLKNTLRELVNDSSFYIIEGIVVDIAEGSCTVRPLTSNSEIDGDTTLYYDVSYPNALTPAKDSFVLMAFVDAVTPYIIYADNLSGITIGSDNKATVPLTQTERNEMERQLISNKGAVIKDGSFRFQVTQAGMILVNGLYYGLITLNEASQIELFRENINIAVNDIGKIYIGKTVSSKVKEFEIKMKSINSGQSAIDDAPSATRADFKMYDAILDFFTTRIEASASEFRAGWEQLLAAYPVASKYIEDINTFFDEGYQKIEAGAARIGCLRTIPKVLADLEPFTKDVDRVTYYDYYAFNALYSSLSFTSGKKARLSTSTVDTDLALVLNFMYSSEYYAVNPKAFKELFNIFYDFYYSKEVTGEAPAALVVRIQSSFVDKYEEILPMFQSGKNAPRDVDIMRINQTQELSALNINDILNNMANTVDKLAKTVSDLIRTGTLPVVNGSPVNYLGLVDFVKAINEVGNEIASTKSDIDDLFATEQVETNGYGLTD